MLKKICAALLVSAVFAASAAEPARPPSDPASFVPPAVVDALITLDSKLGSGPAAAKGAQVTVHYTGWLYEPKGGEFRGRKFDSSLDRGQPFRFPLGAGRVIQGWDEGIVGMKVGGKRTLIIPPDKAYGARGAGGVIPPNATLVFDVELLELR